MQRYNTVRNAKVVTDPATGASRGYGFVRFGSEDEKNRFAIYSLSLIWAFSSIEPLIEYIFFTFESWQLDTTMSDITIRCYWKWL